MKSLKHIVFIFALMFAGISVHGQANPQNANQMPSSVVTESGKFRFYETKQIRGEENYQITQSPNGELIVQAKTDLPFAGQETRPLVNVTLRTTKDLTPESFAIKGPTLLDIEEDTSITIQGKTADIKDRDQNKSVEVPAQLFHDEWLRASNDGDDAGSVLAHSWPAGFDHALACG